MIEIIYEIDNCDYTQLIEKAISVGLACENISCEVDICVLVVGNKKIKKLNNEFRNIDKITDVLSFPMIDFSEQNKSKDKIIKKHLTVFSNSVNLGDIVVSYEKALEQSKQYGHSIEREMVFLVIHSLLHLLGYDHILSRDDTLMRQRQREIINELSKDNEALRI